MPKKSIDRNPITIVSSSGTDSASSDNTLINGLDTSVVASDVISSNELGGYLGTNVQLNLDDLTADALEGQPPRIGFDPIQFSNGDISITHDGRPDWGQAKLVDSAPWEYQHKKWADIAEMPHKYYGNTTTTYQPLTRDTKHINPNGIYDTINLVYGDASTSSDVGLNVSTAGDGDGNPYEFGGTVVYQAVPRSAFQNLDTNAIYPFLYHTPTIKEDGVSDFFNAATGLTLGFNSGAGTSSLGIKDGQAAISLGSPFRPTTYNANLAYNLTNLQVDEPVLQDVGLVVSGILFPADRGVVALVRFPSNSNGVATSFIQNPPQKATTVAEIESRVVAAINLGQGAGPNDGMPGGAVFNNRSDETFPSRTTGQYDLYELHTGQYTSESTRSGNIPALLTSKSPSIGKVRLLTEANAFDGTNTRPGGIPVLFSPYEKVSKISANATISWSDFYADANPETSLQAYVIDNAGTTLAATINTTAPGSIDIDSPSGQTPYTYYAYVKKEQRSFLSYRMPILSDYSPDGLKTPVVERDRFFIKRKPNKDEEISPYVDRLTTAGGYVTFGEQDNYSFQVARYRQVITLTQEYTLDGDTQSGVTGGLAFDQTQPEFNLGSFVLMHFKTERAFEAMVRDGIAPLESDLYSQSLVDYTTLNNNVGEFLGIQGGDGLDDPETSAKTSKSLSVFRPNINFLRQARKAGGSGSIITKSQSYGIHPSVGNITSLDKDNTFFSWVSGVIYASPSTWFAYKDHSSIYPNGASSNYAAETHYTKFQCRFTIDSGLPQGDDLSSEWTNTTPTSGIPFSTTRPTFQLLTSDLTASKNLVSNRLVYLQDDSNNNFTTIIKHQQVWINHSDLIAGGGSSIGGGHIIVTPTGDSVKAVDNLALYDSKQGFCTFTTAGLRPSIFTNNPHKQFENLGIMNVVDDLSNNVSSFRKKLLYHSARKISLLELYGERFNPVGTRFGGGIAVSIDDIYEKDPKGSNLQSGSPHYVTQSRDIVGQDYRNNECFAEVFLQALWSNSDAQTQVLTPKSSGQAFSIYRYDEEGVKVYVELELLPIGGAGDDYALELCTGWDWVRSNENDPQVELGVQAPFKYRYDVPVYRTVENTHTRVSSTDFADAKFLALKNVQYYIECHPSIPYDYAIGAVGIGVAAFQGVPASWNDDTKQNTSIFQLSNTWGWGSATNDADLALKFKDDSDFTSGGSLIRIYELLGDTNTYRASSTISYGETINNRTYPHALLNPFFHSDVGASVHLCGIEFMVQSASEFLISTVQEIQHPHPPSSSNRTGNERSWGERIVEIKPTGRRELPEYGNFTQDIRGYITFSGLGNESNVTGSELLAVSTQTRFALASLFTPRKDTQERFLDESYRIEHSLSTLFNNDDPDSNYQYGNHSDVSGNDAPASGDTHLRANLIGPGIPHFGVGVNGGYISFPVRDELNYSHRQYEIDVTNNGVNAGLYPIPNLMKFSYHGYAGFLRNGHHTKRIQISNPLEATDWLEAQVSGFPNMTRNHLSGSKYGTPPRGVLVFPYQNFHGETTSEFGYTLNHEDNAQANRNPLLDSHIGFYVPNSNATIPGNAGGVDAGQDWVDDANTVYPRLRHAQPDYSGWTSYPDVGYLRAFDLNFGKSNERSPHIPYWNVDWTEDVGGQKTDRIAESADQKGLLESGKWNRFKENLDGTTSTTTVKLRLVGIDWDMISYVDPQFPNARRDGTVYRIDEKPYLMRKRVMRVFVKVPGLTTWLDVGVMNGDVGESYVQYAGNPMGSFGMMNPDGATADKTHRSIDGAGCCVSYKETYLVEEGLVALDLELDVGFVPAFNTLGTDSFQGSANEYEWFGSHDEYLGEKSKVVWSGNSTRYYGDSTYRKWGGGGKEAPLLVKVILSDPDAPSYETYPTNATRLVDRDDLSSDALEIANIYPNGTSEIYDIWAAPNKSYRGHSFPPDDRAPTWARRGLMGIEVLRPDGTNYDYDEVIDRPDFTKINLHGSIDTTQSNDADDRTLYMAHVDNAQGNNNTPSGYLRGADPLGHDGTNVVKTNKITYTFNGNITPAFDGSKITLANKGDG